ncbi:ankyrin repeat-containing domain protein [Cadophora sp. MPI-SDFR-AT-0126]|nr:ankyrin repeat-containing domain protein [Leotiomycetes sp. MPI-SDFR-AT-0126]
MAVFTPWTSLSNNLEIYPRDSSPKPSATKTSPCSHIISPPHRLSITMSVNKKRKATQSPTEDQWNSHRELLQTLYRSTTLLKLMLHMETEHHFIASKNQYERKLRDEWKIRKNVRSDEWEHILREHDKRDQSAKETEVTLRGTTIPKRRIKKEKLRHSLSDLNRMLTSDPKIEGKEDIRVSTPPSTFVNYYRRWPIRTDDLPYSGMLAYLETQNLPFLSFRAPTHSYDKSWYSNSPISYSMDRKDVSFQSEGMSYSSLGGTITDVLDNTFDFSRVFISRFGSDLLNGLRLHGLQRYEGDTESRLQSLFWSSESDASTTFLSFIVQLSSNNMLNEHQMKYVLDLIEDISNSWLQSLLKIRLPSFRAFCDNLVTEAENSRHPAFEKILIADVCRNLCRGRRETLLYRAIEGNVISAIHLLLEEDININARLRSFAYIMMPDEEADKFEQSCTFLGAARNVEVAKVLIALGADVDADHFNVATGLNCTAGQHAAISGNTKLVKALVRAGANLDPNREEIFNISGRSLLGIAVAKESSELLAILLENGAVCSESLQHFGGDRYATELQQACYLGFTDAVEALLQTPSGIHSLRHGKYRWAPLRDAAKNGHHRIVQLLIHAGADVNGTSDLRPDLFFCPRWFSTKPDVENLPSTALIAAVEGGHMEVVNLLIYNDVNLQAPAFAKHGTDILEVAENLGHHDIFLLLEKSGAKRYLSQHGSCHVTELWLAVIRNDTGKIRRLIELGVGAGNILDTLNFYDGKAELVVSVTTVLQTFMAFSHDLNATGPRSGLCALELAIDLGEEEVVRSLVRCGASLKIPDSHKVSILQRAFTRPKRPSHELVAFLLEHGAKVNCQRSASSTSKEPWYYGWEVAVRIKTPLILALQRYDLRMIQLLRRYGADVNLRESANSSTPLQCGITRNRANRQEIVKFLVDQGACVNAPGAEPDGRTAFQEAVSIQPPDLNLLQLLLDKGAKINYPASPAYGRTALQAAIDQEAPDMEVLNLLLDNGADINTPAAAERGVTALQGAAFRGHLKIALILLERGADPDAAGSPEDGRTAPEGAAEWGRLDMVQLLLNAGATPTESAIRYAEEESFFTIADLIRDEIDKMNGS